MAIKVQIKFKVWDWFGLKLGDIVFILKQMKHDSFVRSGDDLIYTSKIPLLSALTGTNLSIKTLDGRELTVPINETIA